LVNRVAWGGLLDQRPLEVGLADVSVRNVRDEGDPARRNARLADPLNDREADEENDKSAEGEQREALPGQSATGGGQLFSPAAARLAMKP
jgi:hypothetical protein